MKAYKHILLRIIAAVILACSVSSCSTPATNVRVCFFGRVVDQNTNPIPDVKIGAVVRHWRPYIFYSAKEIHITAKTDMAGRFKLDGASGDVFDLEYVQKDGYELEPYTQRNFGAIGGSIENPVVFKMWSTNIHEQLISNGTRFEIQPDGRKYFINLTNGTISESAGGDLKAWIRYSSLTPQGQLTDWSCEISAINGGLSEELNGNSSMYLAPTGGYKPSFQLQQQIKGGQRGSIGTRRFYLSLNNGQQYGRMTIELMAPYNDQISGMIRISYVINPSGSRILR